MKKAERIKLNLEAHKFVENLGLDTWEREVVAAAYYKDLKRRRKIILSRTNKPQDVHKDAWFYVNGRSIDLMVRHSHGTIKTRVPMKMIESLRA